MFTRSELEIKTIPELRDLCRRYGLRPTGNAGYKVSWITSLMAFPAIALNQLQEGRGLKRLPFEDFQNIGAALDRMGTPTDEQSALIKISLEGRRMKSPERWEQESLLNLYKAKLLLEQVMDLLGE
ncbi:hypothetical protein I8752_34910 [Nostocaceae cyanobacterium CENA369]|uniref:Uncharacterized protein n=1 Tax=Dendronalium phyllosphericum CENA369 TaxID=1725256 RepID=A0A8J7ILR9_9NOST|nr:hypothetical protein [Dendronalium phyllosphericum]MBH8578046.1 hypothetical protein [Dendronalium phyllosphericum CENA369]